MHKSIKNNNIFPAISKRSKIDPFIVMDVMAKANARQRKGEDIIHMEVGQPSTPAPLLAIEAAKVAACEHVLGYTEALGLPELRQRIAEYYLETYNVEISAERVVITTGSSAGFVLAFLATLDVGERVGITCPGYPCYRYILKSLGNDIAYIETNSNSLWKPQLKEIIELHDKNPLSALLIASPANPTGTMLPNTQLADLIKLCENNSITFISDEIYHGLTYERDAMTALKYSPSAIVINSFSKYFSMTGWRIGWMVVPDELVRVVERLQQNLFISPPTISQFAALASFESKKELESIRENYAKNRAVLLEELTLTGFQSIAPADGAFYLYADISKFSADSKDFAEKMLDQIGVAITPGLDFDEGYGHHYVRFCYSCKHCEIIDAVHRIKRWLT